MLHDKKKHHSKSDDHKVRNSIIAKETRKESKYDNAHSILDEYIIERFSTQMEIEFYYK